MRLNEPEEFRNLHCREKRLRYGEAVSIKLLEVKQSYSSIECPLASVSARPRNSAIVLVP